MNPNLNRIDERFFLFLATGFGAGYSPVAPGTAGNPLRHPHLFLLSQIPSPLYELTLVTFFFLSVWISDNARDIGERRMIRGSSSMR